MNLLLNSLNEYPRLKFMFIYYRYAPAAYSLQNLSTYHGKLTKPSVRKSLFCFKISSIPLVDIKILKYVLFLKDTAFCLNK